MATKLYFRRDLASYSNLPATEQSTLTPDANYFETDSSKNYRMSTTKSTVAQTTLTNTSTGDTNAHNYYCAKFVSNNLNQTSVAANTWTVEYAAIEANAQANYPRSGAGVMYVNCYVWKPSNGTKYGTILDGNSVSDGEEAGTTQTVISFTFSGSAVSSLTAGDAVIVFEVWAQVTQASTTARLQTFCFDGTTEASTTNEAAFISTPENLEFLPDVSLSRVYKYNMNSRVSQSRIYKYNIASRISLSRIYKYNIISRVSQSRIYKYNIITRISKDSILKYNVFSRISKSSILKYNLIGRISKSSILKYNVIQRISQSSILKYDVIGRISKPITLLWNIVVEDLERVSKDQTYKWNVESRVSKPSTIKYNINQRISKSSISKWHITNYVSQQLTLKWNIIQRISKSLSLRYVLGEPPLTRISKALTLRWQVSSSSVAEPFSHTEGKSTGRRYKQFESWRSEWYRTPRHLRRKISRLGIG